MLGFAAIALLLGALATVKAATVVYDKSNPIFAGLVIGSDDARVTVWTSKTLTDAAGIRDRRIVEYAQAALRHDPLNPGALRALAIYYEGARQGARAERLATVSAKVSRRDPLTQLLLSQYAARRNNLDAAMEHLDTALTTVGRGRDQVFPIISAQLRNAELRTALSRLVEPRNSWIAEYLDYVMRHDQDGAKTAAEILREAPIGNAAPVYAMLGGELLSGLAEAGDPALLRETYARARGKRPDVTAVPGFNRATSDPAIGWLGWTGTGDGSAGADLRTVGGDGVQAVVYASAGTNHALAMRRVLYLRPGRYRHFEERSASFGPPGTIGQFEMTCIGTDARRIWEGPAAAPQTDFKNTEGPTVPPNCPAQMLELFVSSPLGAGGAEFVIEAFDLQPAD